MLKNYTFSIHSFNMQKILIFWLILCLCSSCLLSRIDRTPYQQTKFYQKFQQISDTLSPKSTNSDTLQAGWAKVNITPGYRVHLAGYGTRAFKKSVGIHDSIWVRAFVFRSTSLKTALVTADLLITPPKIVRTLQKQLPALGWNIDRIYFTATHTHNSTGGWAKRVVSRLITGKYKKRVVRDLTAAYMNVLQKAEKNLAPVQMAYTRISARTSLHHRIFDTATVDDGLRTVFLRKKSGETAAISIFQAHATNINDPIMLLSGDYPTALVDGLEKSQDIDFAAFCAGGVGSHAPETPGGDFVGISNLANTLSQKILATLPQANFRYEKQLEMLQMDLPLRKPQMRTSQNYRLRPWLFYALYGNYPARLSVMRTGSVLWAGVPCDFSGELTLTIQKQLTLPLIITSFNGGYIGYITPDKYYDYKHYETRVMNWFGPGNGEYFSEVLLKLLRKVEK
jgi:neutral ceramidase